MTEMIFMFARPKCHHVAGKIDRPLKDDAPFWHTSSPDRDKLERATNDAMTGVIWVDDSQVAATLSQKIYIEPGMPSGALIRVYRLDSDELIMLANA